MTNFITSETHGVHKVVDVCFAVEAVGISDEYKKFGTPAPILLEEIGIFTS